ncbi:hypothetical protein HB779_12140 [Phyllobacterium sp. 628]|uniref:hypothetical protein n=1 Tax=Phyllobacterium sp. 628 TaxID=2718938 RepID=UPI0016625538|nr:hypothetical protein [Phyllobacterium sp. 628]QND52568.1 hypothetical protein HB779_12140 [Phyllobacterium sp. 628]
MPIPKILIDAACGTYRAAGAISGHSETWSDLKIATLARDTQMKRGGRAEKYLNHYLDGSGEPIQFSLLEMFKDAENVRAVVIKKINRDVSEAEGQKSPIVGMVGNVPVPQVEIDYTDWRYATGSINIQYKVLQDTARSGVALLEVEIWCVNIYRWHPEADRHTQCVHRSLDRLKNPQSETTLDLKGLGVRLSAPPGTLTLEQRLSVTQVTKRNPAKEYKMFAPRVRILIPRKTSSV